MDLRQWLGEGAQAVDSGVLRLFRPQGRLSRAGARGDAEGTGEDGGGGGGDFGVRGVQLKAAFEAALCHLMIGYGTLRSCICGRKSPVT